MNKTELYFCIDVETDGPLPGVNSMLSLASVAVSGKTLTVVDEFTINYEIMPSTMPDPSTEQFWLANPDAWNETRKNTIEAKEATWTYRNWVTELSRKQALAPVRVGHPIVFDGMWDRWYLLRHTGEDPFSHSGIDMKTIGMTLLNQPYRSVNKRMLKKHWSTKLPHTHVALDDAREQAEIFIQMMHQIRHAQ